MNYQGRKLYSFIIHNSTIHNYKQYLCPSHLKQFEVSTSKQAKQKLATLSAELKSGDERKISTALKALHAHGDATIIPVVLELWEGGLSHQNENEVKELLAGLKDTSTVEPLMDYFRESENHEFQRKMLNIFWNSKLDFSSYLSDFIVFAIEGDYLDCLESLTVIEQFESTVPESAVMESQLLMKEYFAKEEPTEDKKMQLLQEILIHLKDFEGESDFEDVFFDED